MQVVSKISGLSSLDSSFDFIAEYEQDSILYYLYEAVSCSNVFPQIFVEDFGEEELYYLEGSSFKVNGFSLAECFKKAEVILNQQKDIFALIPSANFFGINDSESSYIFGFQFAIPEYNLYPHVFFDVKVGFDWHYRHEGERQEGRCSSLSSLLFLINQQINNYLNSY